MKIHQVALDVVSTQGKGTTFKLRLPIHPDRAPAADGSEDFIKKALLNETVWEKLIAS